MPFLTRICNSTSCLSFRNALINFNRPSENKIFNIQDKVSIKLLTRLCLGFSQLREHKFRHILEDTLNPLCPCSIEPETTMRLFLRCHFYNVIWANLMRNLQNLNSLLPTENNEKLICILKFIKDSHRFDNSLF